MRSYPKISIITPCFNQAAYIEECILSVIGQDYPNLEYIIIDGGSTDGTVDIIRKYGDKITYWVSEKDNGFCHALQKGFRQSTGDIMAWINGDDKYFPGAFHAVAEIFQTYPQIQWLMGHPMLYTKEGLAINHIAHEWARWSKYRFFSGDFLAIQQESTFWRRTLWEKAGGVIGVDVAVAVDFELWCRFFRHEHLYTTNALIGGFRFSSDQQLSFRKKKEYIDECRQILKREWRQLPLSNKLLIFLRCVVGRPLTPFYQLRLPVLSRLYVWIMDIPDVIYYDFKKHQFSKYWHRR